MSAEIIPFDFESQAVRIVEIDDAPWFVALDVCRVLGISKHRDAVARLDEDERASTNTDTLGGPQEMAIINESGLFALILRSRKPQAKRFRKWVTAEVLPTLRKTGRYKLQPAAGNRAHDPFQFARERSDEALAHMRNCAAMSGLLEVIADAPIWPSGRRPPWWHDLEVREFLTVTHRQMQMHQAEALGRARFGARCPRKSTIGAFWLRIDKAKGLPAPKPRQKKRAIK